MTDPQAQPLPGNPLSVFTTLDGSGNGSVQIGPQRVREHWQVEAVGVSVSTQVAEAQCSVNVGSPPANPGNFFGQTATGSTGDTCAVETDIVAGQLVMVRWIGGDAGAQATASIYGTFTFGSPPS
jgi:hypothetical protein